MKIAFLGAGNMATGLAKRWLRKGHDLYFSYSRDVEKLRNQAASVGAAVRTGDPADAAAWADVVVLTAPYNAARDAIKAAHLADGKVLWSIVNPLKPDYSGLQVGTTTSGAEELAKIAPQTRFVAALPPFAEALHGTQLSPDTSTVFVCGDDESARSTVIGLVKELNVDAVDAGPLFAARFFEPALMGLVYLAYGRNLGTGVSLHLNRL